MGGDIVLQSKIVNEDGEVKGLNEFIASIQVKPLTVETFNDNVDITQVTFQKIANTKILIFEDQAFNLLALKEMMYFGLKLKNQTTFYSSGSAIAQAMQQFFKEKGENEVAIVIIDYNMPGMNGIELINWTRGYFK
jgi:PleD family two-component response regulator